MRWGRVIRLLIILLSVMDEIASQTLMWTAIGVILTGILVYFTVWDRVKPFINRLIKNPISLGKNKPDSLKIVNIAQNSRWYIGTHNNKSAIWLNTSFAVTNVSNKENQLISAHLKKINTFGFILAKPNYHNIWGIDEIIPPRETFEHKINFFIYRKHPKNGKNLSFDFIFQDKYANTYFLKNVIFDFTQRHDR